MSFISADSYRGKLEDPLSQNRYTYCHNNPYKYDDPSGHTSLKAQLARSIFGIDGAGIPSSEEQNTDSSSSTSSDNPGNNGDKVEQTGIVPTDTGGQGTTLPVNDTTHIPSPGSKLKEEGETPPVAENTITPLDKTSRFLDDLYGRQCVIKDAPITPRASNKKTESITGPREATDTGTDEIFAGSNQDEPMKGNPVHTLEANSAGLLGAGLLAQGSGNKKVKLISWLTAGGLALSGKMTDLFSEGINFVGDLISDLFEPIVVLEPEEKNLVIDLPLTQSTPVILKDPVSEDGYELEKIPVIGTRPQIIHQPLPIEDIDSYFERILLDDVSMNSVDKIDNAESISDNSLTNAQKSRLNSLNNTINNHLTDSDFSGTLRDLQGNPVPNGYGGYYNHEEEMRNSYRALQKIKEGLEGSLKNPNLSNVDKSLLQEGLDKANSYINKIEDLFYRVGSKSR